jgi:predicted TIM-barrel fold metal-dependent hydrolase
MSKLGIAGWNLNEMLGEVGVGGDYNERTGISAFTIQLSGEGASSGIPIMVRDFKFYKAAEWRIESIKDYRDEYMQIAAVRVRGERSSRRRTYG